MKRAALLATALLSLLFTLPALAELGTLSDAINKAGLQRMLSQRMVKNYCMVGLDVQRETAAKVLKEDIALFEAQLRELQAYPPAAPQREQLAKVDALWKEVRRTLETAPVRTAVPALLETSEELLRAANKVVLGLQDISGTPQGRLVNVSGRQRMLTQRLSKYYMLRAWKFDTAEVRAEMEQSKNEFTGAMLELESATVNTAQINGALATARKQWKLFLHGLERGDADLVPLIVAMSGDKLVGEMNEITAMYAALPAQ